MPQAYRAHVARQDRSRLTQRRLLEATIAILNTGTLEAATLPRIARAAGVSPAVVYRRFPDKNALLEAVVVDVYERQRSILHARTPAAVAPPLALEAFAGRFVRQVVDGYRRSGHLLRAIRRFVAGSRRAAFKKRVAAYELATFNTLVDRLLESAHASGRRTTRDAAALAVFMVVNTLLDLIVLTDDRKEWAAVLPDNDEALTEAATAMLIRMVETPGPRKTL